MNINSLTVNIVSLYRLGH